MAIIRCIVALLLTVDACAVESLSPHSKDKFSRIAGHIPIVSAGGVAGATRHLLRINTETAIPQDVLAALKMGQNTPSALLALDTAVRAISVSGDQTAAALVSRWTGIGRDLLSKTGEVAAADAGVSARLERLRRRIAARFGEVMQLDHVTPERCAEIVTVLHGGACQDLPSASVGDFKIGQTVVHPRYGRGVVSERLTAGGVAAIKVEFETEPRAMRRTGNRRQPPERVVHEFTDEMNHSLARGSVEQDIDSALPAWIAEFRFTAAYFRLQDFQYLGEIGILDQIMKRVPFSPWQRYMYEQFASRARVRATLRGVSPEGIVYSERRFIDFVMGAKVGLSWSSRVELTAEQLTEFVKRAFDPETGLIWERLKTEYIARRTQDAAAKVRQGRRAGGIDLADNVIEANVGTFDSLQDVLEQMGYVRRSASDDIGGIFRKKTDARKQVKEEGNAAKMKQIALGIEALRRLWREGYFPAQHSFPMIREIWRQHERRLGAWKNFCVMAGYPALLTPILEIQIPANSFELENAHLTWLLELKASTNPNLILLKNRLVAKYLADKFGGWWRLLMDLDGTSTPPGLSPVTPAFAEYVAAVNPREDVARLMQPGRPLFSAARKLTVDKISGRILLK